MRPSRSACARLLGIAVVVGVLSIAAPLAGGERSSQKRSTNEAFKIEDRGWGSRALDGRSTNAISALGLSGVLPSVHDLRRQALGDRSVVGNDRVDLSAGAATTVSEPTDTPLAFVMPSGASVVDGRGMEGLVALSYPWSERLRGWVIMFLPERAGLRRLTLAAPRRIEIYVRSGDAAWDIGRVLAHEIGHAVDLVHNDFEDRERWRSEREIALGTPWWPESNQSDFATGAGDFAECFASWQVSSASLSTVGSQCSETDLLLVAELSS